MLAAPCGIGSYAAYEAACQTREDKARQEVRASTGAVCWSRGRTLEQEISWLIGRRLSDRAI